MELGATKCYNLIDRQRVFGEFRRTWWSIQVAAALLRSPGCGGYPGTFPGDLSQDDPEPVVWWGAGYNITVLAWCFPAVVWFESGRHGPLVQQGVVTLLDGPV